VRAARTLSEALRMNGTVDRSPATELATADPVACRRRDLV
jgi:hypothetical protein